VRGLDYYTRTVFEIVDTSGALGAQDALGGGGRYDQLFTELGARRPVPAFGFGLGIERLLLAAFAIIVGAQEIKDGVVKLKDLARREERTIARGSLVDAALAVALEHRADGSAAE
jgi:histidyl-tRNA synthetase